MTDWPPAKCVNGNRTTCLYGICAECRPDLVETQTKDQTMKHHPLCSSLGSVPGHCDCSAADNINKNDKLNRYQNSLKTLDRLFKVSDVVYISGPMTGYPDFNRAMFTKVKKLVATMGATVISPADIKQGPPWEHQMRQCVRYIADCTKMLMLPGWENSKGALIEHLIASQVLIPRWYLEDNLLRASEFTMVKLDVSFMTRFMEERLINNTAEEREPND